MDKVQNIHKYIWLEFVIWLIVLVILVGGVRVYHHIKLKKYPTYQIFMPDVDGLIVGSPVKYMGVQVGHITKIKIVSNEVYIKMIITDKDFKFPQGVIATVEFNGLGGSKSLEVYPPTKDSLASGKLIVVSDPVRLSDAMSLLDDMFDKIGSIMSRLSIFAKETGTVKIDIDQEQLDIINMEKNVSVANKILKRFNRDDNNQGVKNEQNND